MVVGCLVIVQRAYNRFAVSGLPNLANREFPACMAAEIDIRGSIDVELRALDWLFLVWLPSNGYAPAHQPMFEAWNGRPFAHGVEYFELRAQLPIVHESVPF
jgi:DNA gyrase inhibitor GyrI